jgi:predicted phage terminase large subunit-like protein
MKNEEQKRKLLEVFSNPHNIHLFAQFIFPEHCKYETPTFHRHIFDLITDDSKKYIALAAPRKHAKSTMVNLIALTWLCVHHKVRFPIICSDSYSQAALHLETFKLELEQNERLRYLYGDLTSDKWAEGEVILANGIIIKAIGQQMKARGLKYRDARPDLFIADDLENDELVQSKDRIDKLERWFNAVVIPALDDTGRIFYIGTVLSYGSFLARILDETRYPDWYTEDYAALMKDGRKSMDGEPIWPERYTREHFVNLRNTSAQKGLLDVFYCEYMNDPVSGMNQEFSPDLFQYYHELPEEYHTFTTVDLAISEKEHADYTVVCTVAVDPENNWYVAEVTRERMDPMETIKTIFDHATKWQPRVVGIEGVGYQRALQAFVKEEMKRRNMFFNIEELKATRGTKEERIRGLIPRFKAGTIFLKPGMDDLEDELLKFPKGEHDDIIDALAYQLQIAYAAKEGPKRDPYKGRVDIDRGLEEIKKRNKRKRKRIGYLNGK